MGGTDTNLSIEWLAEYGCAVLFHRANDQWSGKLSIDVIGLDKHELEVHAGQSNYQYTSIAKSFATLHVSEISTDEKTDFWRQFTKLFDKIRSEKGGNRSAAGKKKGHQKTPAFVHAVLLQAKICTCQEKRAYPDVLPKGGFTDVGLHTGGQRRDTCFALARSVFHWLFDQACAFGDQSNLCTDGSHFDPVMVHFHMYLLEKAIVVVDDIDISMNASNVKSEVDQRIDFLFEMLRHVAILAARLADDGYDLCKCVEKLKEFNKRIHRSKRMWDVTTLQKYTLEESLDNFRCPEIQLPEFAPPQVAGELSTEALQLLIEENIGQLSLINDLNHDLKTAAVWAQQVKGEYVKSTTKLFIFLRQIEQVFWRVVENNLGSQPLTVGALSDLMHLLDHYREAIEGYAKSAHASLNTLLNRIRCVELLLVWVGYCAVFNTVKRMHPDMADFGTALHYQDLKYLLLHDETHIAAMERVAQFLYAHSVSGKDLFSTREEQNWSSPTFTFGAMFANRNFLSKWQTEQYNAKRRVDGHWTEVVRKQNLAKMLRIELRSLETDLSYESIKADDFNQHNGQRTYQGTLAKNEVVRLNARISSKKKEIFHAERAPSPVIQPLPSDMDKAMKIIFFMYMPPEFQYLSRLTFTAQQALVPRPWFIPCGGVDGVTKVDFYNSISVKRQVYCWSEHYNNNQKCSYYSPNEVLNGVSLSVRLSMHYQVPAPIGPDHVDKLTNRTQDIWYPDTNDIRMVWSGGKHSWDRNDKELWKEFNPFNIAGEFTG